MLVSCKKSLDVNADWKDVTVVYGILNQSDTIHYIKITKAFLGPGDALEYAKNPDSSNYPDILKVSLNEYTNGNPGRKIMLRDTLITNKDSGIFYFPVQKLFYSKEKLSELKDYKLTIIDTVTSKTIEASKRPEQTGYPSRRNQPPGTVAELLSVVEIHGKTETTKRPDAGTKVTSVSKAEPSNTSKVSIILRSGDK